MLFEQLGIQEKIIPSAKRELNSRPYLALACQSFTLRLLESAPQLDQTRAKILDLWTLLLNNLSSMTNMRPDTADSLRRSDLDLETTALFLFLFHNLNINEQKAVFVDLANRIVSVQSDFDFPPFFFARILCLFDYLLKHFDEPSSKLIEIVDKQLLTFTLPMSSMPYTDAFSWLQNLYANLGDEQVSNLFFSLSETDKRPSQLAIHTLSTEKNLNYDKLYACLVHSAGFGRGIQWSNELTNQEYASISYNFAFAWSILQPNSLPVSTKFVQDMSTRIFDSVDGQLRLKNITNNSIELIHLLRLVFEASEQVIKPVKTLVTNSTANETHFYVKMWSDREVVCTSDLILLKYQLDHLETSIKRLALKLFILFLFFF